jgi:hypothetical protein
LDEQSFMVTVLPGPVIQSINISNDVVRVAWSAIADLTYRLQFRTNLLDTNWSDVQPDVTATGPTAWNTDSFSSGVERFYRVILVP